MTVMISFESGKLEFKAQLPLLTRGSRANHVITLCLGCFSCENGNKPSPTS